MKIIRSAVAILILVGLSRLPNAAAQTLTTLYSFTGGSDGANPRSGLVLGQDGNYYGTTYYGGEGYGFEGGYGTVFSITTNGALTTLYTFTGYNDGELPWGALVQTSDGLFYGTADGGLYPGSSGYGTVFSITTNGALTPLDAFTGGNNGAFPIGDLVETSDGSFYGTTDGNNFDQAIYGYGTVFKISTNGALTTLYAFTGGNDGANPSSGLVLGSDGDFYGTTIAGGTNNAGTVFKISSAGTLTTLHSFTGGGYDGQPTAGLTQGSDGNFYGTTDGYGISGYAGTVFKISSAGILTNLHSFTGGADGGVPGAQLVQGRDGNFYGTTSKGGTSTNCSGGCGTVFRISPAGTLTTLYSFTGGADGSNPQAALVQASDGTFYGSTSGFGTSGNGTVFKLNVMTNNCSFLISSTNAMFGAAGGTGSVSVATSDGCAWSAISNDGFLTITSGGSGSGNETVDYSVAANSNTNGLMGTMTIAGQTFTVTQSSPSSQIVTSVLAIAKLTAAVNFAKVNADSASLTATLDLGVRYVPYNPTGVKVTVSIGGVVLPFKLDKNGRGLSGTSTCRLTYTKPAKGKPEFWTLTVALSKGTWQDEWAGYGLVNETIKTPGNEVKLPLVVVVDTEAFAAEPKLHYTATLNKAGSAK